MNTLGLLLGIFVVPLAMLAACHRFRRLSRQQRRIVWGLIIGYGLALLLVLPALFIPPVMWAPDQPARSFLAYWGLFLIPVTGALAGRLLPLPADKLPENS